eukprot:TRINITY_DN1133_c0_g1_i1.p1 TRINITY_DN1133_c0_g1~~TRINITY_DN1133_c0_g1_i1.p1  ORF type:complete len:106 (+),score=13.04 TRINITY_DN1133_c0_g1_i1:134-451(+)
MNSSVKHLLKVMTIVFPASNAVEIFSFISSSANIQSTILLFTFQTNILSGDSRGQYQTDVIVFEKIEEFVIHFVEFWEANLSSRLEDLLHLLFGEDVHGNDGNFG